MGQGDNKTPLVGSSLKSVENDTEPLSLSKTHKPQSVPVHREWISDYRVPHSVLKYNLSREGPGNRIINTDIDFQYSFTPEMNLNAIDQQGLGTAGSHPSQFDNTQETTNEDNDHKIDEHIGAFSGYFAVPTLTVNLPNRCRDDGEEPEFMRDVPKICYQNHFESDDSTFMFGGVYASASMNFTHLGIPAEVDVSKIKVYFPYQLPPFVDTKILTNPYMIPHPHFLQYNATRGSVTYLDTSEMEDFPGRFSGMASTRISPQHFFFYGGFELKDKSVKHIEKDDLWIVEKDIIMNEDGFIIDTSTLRFRKIELNTNNLAIKIGRIGMGICSNVYESKEPNDNRPEIINEYSLSNVMLESKNNSTKPKYPVDMADSIRVDAATPNVLPHYPQGRHLPDLEPSPETKRPLLHKLVTTSTSDSRYSENATNTPTNNTTPVARKSPINRLLPLNSSSSQYSASSSTPGRTVTNSSNNSSVGTTTTTSSSSKRAGVLARSTSIFRRHRHDKNIKTPHPLKVTYNESARTKYLNPVSTTSSRATSPVKNSVGKNSSQSPTMSPKSPTPCSSVRSLSPIRLETSTPMNRIDSTKYKSFENSTPRSSPGLYINTSTTTQQTANSVRSSPTSEIKFEGSQRSTETPDYFSASTTAGTLSTKTSLTQQPTSVLFRSPANVSIFVFGGFILPDERVAYEKDHSNRAISQFKATNELLKIDMSIAEEPPFVNSVNFVKEALVSRVGDDKLSNIYVEDKNQEWPSPRGYFAYSLIDNDSALEQTCAVDASKRGDELGLVSSSDIDRANAVTGRLHPHNGNTSKLHECKTMQDFFDSKSLIVQGGCAENNQFFGDFYKFVFKTCSWEKIQSYAYDYYNIPLGAGDDEISDKLTRGSEVEHAELKEAEYRCCHHTALYYKNEERDYIFLIGGVKNNHLRLFDSEPHKSDKLDVSRLSTLQLNATNKNLLRIAVFNTQTQVWRFMRYYYDVTQALDDRSISRSSYFTNARISHVGGTSSINGKILTLCQGLASIAPERKNDMEQLKDIVPIEELLWGGYIQFTFPGL
ncbi:Guanine nucleotide-binding protein subunit beta 1 [Candida tropicalis]